VFAAFLAMRIPIFAGVIAWVVLLGTMTVALPEYIAASPVLTIATSPLTAEFMMGLIIGVLWLRGRPANSLFLGAISGAALALSMVLQFHFFATDIAVFDNAWGAVALRVTMFGIPIAVVLYALVTYEREASRRPPVLLVTLGDWSYSTYLFHFMVMSAVGRAVQYVFGAHTGYASIVLFVSCFLAANLAAAVIFIFFERPTLRWLYSLRRPERLHAGTPVARPIGE
jgi:exopolysaccharide production protein ExoZ